MNSVVWKYPVGLPLREPRGIVLPKEAKILSIGWQRERDWAGIVLWALVPHEVSPPPDAVRRKFMAFGTGTPFAAPGLTYMGTVTEDPNSWAGPLVWHLFEVGA